MPDSPGVLVEDVTEEEALCCDNCGAVVDEYTIFHNERLGLAVCESCDLAHPELYSCSHCGEEHDSDEAAYDCCRYSCDECGTEYRSEDEAYDCCRHYCPECGSSYTYEEDAMDCCRPEGADYPRLSDETPIYTISVPEIEGRPARLCSIEQEVTRGGREAAQMLYDYGYADDAVIENYSWSPSRGRVGVCQDGSLPVEGGEIIYSRFNLDQQADIERLSGAAHRMRQLAREADVVRVGKAAGIHIHISATAENGLRLGPMEMTALHELFCYGEDAIYGIAASGWDDHRQSASGRGGYCRPVPKMEDANAWRINRAMRQERYFGLNFGRLLQAASRCSCGAAQFGVWQDCECGVYDAATVEWRVFNASTKPQTLHAWLLLAQAMTAHAFRHPVGTLGINAYGDTDPVARWDVLEHLLQLLPLLDEEQDVITEAAKKSPLFRTNRR